MVRCRRRPCSTGTRCAGAGGYMVYLFEESDLTHPVYDPENVGDREHPLDPGRGSQGGAGREQRRRALLLVRPTVRVHAAVRRLRSRPRVADRRRDQTRSTSSRRRWCSPPRRTNSTVADEITFSWEDYRTTNANFPSYPAGRHEAVAERHDLPDPGGPVRHDHRRQRHRRPDRGPDDLHRLHRPLPRGRPLVAGPGDRRGRQPARHSPRPARSSRRPRRENLDPDDRRSPTSGRTSTRATRPRAATASPRRGYGPVQHVPQLGRRTSTPGSSRSAGPRSPSTRRGRSRSTRTTTPPGRRATGSSR